MNVKIISDGTPHGTKFQTEVGKQIDGITGVSIHADNDGVRVSLDLMFIPFEMAAKASMIGPNGKEVRRIEYADGSSEEFPA